MSSAIRAHSSYTADNNLPSSSFFTMSLLIPTMETMEEVGALISIVSQPPDVIFLDGDLGAGKTCFARGFVQCKLGMDENENGSDDSSNSKKPMLQVTSPTYLLSNTYSYRDEESDRIQEYVV